MEQENNTYSDTSTAESHHNNHPEKPITRLYDCVFCKRGFTNAQALGGHMNIHRKDKAKAKKKNHEDRLSIQSFNSNSSFSPRIVTADFFQVIGGHVDDRVYLPPPANYEYCFFPVWSRANNLDDRTYQNLNLRTGAGHHEEEEEEVDLELRLGRLL